MFFYPLGSFSVNELDTDDEDVLIEEVYEIMDDDDTADYNVDENNNNINVDENNNTVTVGNATLDIVVKEEPDEERELLRMHDIFQSTSTLYRAKPTSVWEKKGIKTSIWTTKAHKNSFWKQENVQTNRKKRERSGRDKREREEREKKEKERRR